MFIHSASNGCIFKPYRHFTATGEQSACAGSEGPRSEKKAAKESKEPAKTSPRGEPLGEADLRQLQELKARDRQVRAHEAAHLAAAGELATGGASFTYRRGPDGVSYAIGGEVGIDISPVSGDPAATIRKASAIKRAALAPADPSAQDRKIAAAADQMQVRAQVDLSAERKKIRLQAVKAYTDIETRDKADVPSLRIRLTA